MTVTIPARFPARSCGGRPRREPDGRAARPPCVVTSSSAESAVSPPPQVIALSSALCSAVSTALIQRGLRRSNFYAGFWINIAVGVIGLWSAVLLLVPFEEYNWRAVPYFVFSGVVGTTPEKTK